MRSSRTAITSPLVVLLLLRPCARNSSRESFTGCQMNLARSLLSAFCVCLIGVTAALSQDAAKKSAEAVSEVTAGPFLVKPYLQLGHVQAQRQIVLVWHTIDSDSPWAVDYRPGAGRRWQTAQSPSFTRVAVPGTEPHRVYHVALADLEPGQIFAYRVSSEGKVVFESEARAPKAADQPYRFVVFGDCGADTPEERAIAYRTLHVQARLRDDHRRHRLRQRAGFRVPHQVLADLQLRRGVPVDRARRCLRSTLFMAAPGNHDIASRDLGKTPDGLAYFYYWLQPLNGPIGKIGGPITAPSARTG